MPRNNETSERNMSQRIAPITPEEFADVARIIYAERPLPADMRSMSVSNLELMLGNHPNVAKAYLGFGLQLLLSGELSERDRELIVLRVAWRTKATYSWGHHVHHMQGKFSPEDFAALREGPDAKHWSAYEAALVRASDEVLDDHRIADATWQVLAGRLNTRQLMEVVFVVGNYSMLAACERSFGFTLEEAFQGPEFAL
jgi:alkylhydroperoxidase family enzyme